ncbi:MAG: group III truncated hemoglobin [Pseudomonadales bacterium]|nr:group III truncated hemoglobin [Pseudomonadales bacterium]
MKPVLFRLEAEVSDAVRDIENGQDVGILVDRFYDKVLADPLLAPVFLDVAGIDILEHTVHIKAYWRKLLLNGDDYHRHTMNIHRRLAEKTRITANHFDRWLALFTENIDELFQGENAERAKKVAGHIAENMARVMIR